ncbi:MAG: hypothetical protein AVDCRST_MAG79-1206, partial [uncultured Thermoleophilia bacterium]
ATSPLPVLHRVRRRPCVLLPGRRGGRGVVRAGRGHAHQPGQEGSWPPRAAARAAAPAGRGPTRALPGPPRRAPARLGRRLVVRPTDPSPPDRPRGRRDRRPRSVPAVGRAGLARQRASSGAAARAVVPDRRRRGPGGRLRPRADHVRDGRLRPSL